MRKADLVAAVSDKTGIEKVDVIQTMEAIFSVIKDTMASGNDVFVRGFGSFVIKKRAAKTGRNIKRNKTVHIPEHYVPSFKPAKIFVEEVKSKVTTLPE
jgi:DNA-binding protein HU-beta